MRFHFIVTAVLLAALIGACDSLESAKDKAAKHLTAGRLDEARIEASNALQVDDRDVQAHLILARVLFAQGDFVTADSVLSRAAQLGSDRPSVDRLRARLFLRIKSYARLLDEIKPTADHRGEVRAEILAARGQAQLATGRYDEARIAFKESLEVDPSFPDGHIGEAQLAFRDGMTTAALKAVDEVLARHPTHVSAWQVKAAMLDAQGAVDQALEAYGKAAQADTYDSLSLLAAAELQLRVGRLDAAQGSVDQARKRTPNALPVHFLQALIQFERGRFDQVLAMTHEMLRVQPRFLAAQLLAGRALLARGELGQAEERLRAVVQSAPEDRTSRKLLAQTMLGLGNAKGALEVLRPISNGKTDAGAATLAAEAYLRLKDYTRAVASYEDVVRLQPGEAMPLTRLGVARYLAGDTAEGVAVLEKAASSSRSGFHAHVLLAMEALGRRDFKRALTEAQQLQSGFADNPIAFNLAGIAHIGLGDASSARNSFERAASLDSRFWPAVSNLVRLDLAAGRQEAAKGRIERFLASDKGVVEAWMAWLQIAGDRQRFIDGLEAARRADPNAVGVRQALVRTYLDVGSSERALPIAREVAAIAPGQRDSLESLGLALLAAGKVGEAMTTFRDLASRFPQMAVVHVRVGQAAAALSDTGSAEASFRRALQIEPGNAEGVSELTALLVRANRVADALQLVEGAARVNPLPEFADAMKGDVLYAAKDFGAAARAYDSAFRIQPRGIFLIKWHRASGAAGEKPALQRLLFWLEKNPRDLDTRSYVADRLYIDGQYRLAIEQYEVVVKSDPYRASAFNNLASALLQFGDRRALGLAETAYRLKPDDGAILDTLGVTQMRFGDPAAAVETLRKARARLPDSTESQVHYALALAKTGRRDEARSELKQLLAGNNPPLLNQEARALLEPR